MDRDELEKRYKQAEFNSMAYMCEHGIIKPEQNSSEPEAPNAIQTIAQKAGLKTGLDPYVSLDARLRRWAGLK